MILENIKSCNDIKKLNIKELNILSNELRDEIVKTVELNGGHLASNLGVVELIVGLLYVFDFEKDKIIFDVGHQSYAYKILTSRLKEFSSLRKKDGISGFPDPDESKFDFYAVGHAGTSISAGLGYCYSRDKVGDDYFVITLVGDASIFNGENLEAITGTNIKPKKFLVILNDNGMSISKNNNGLYKVVSKMTVSKSYNSFNNFLAKTIGRTFFGKFLRRVKLFVKRTLSLNTVSDSVGLKYVGLFDGHNLKSIIKLLENIKENEISSLLHLKTVKGKGVEFAENDATQYHGIGEKLVNKHNHFSSSISEILNEVYQKNNKFVAITAGMADGVGLIDFSKTHPDCFIDVGIAEEYAVSLAGGISKNGILPFVFMYSTFLQRGYDQIVHDICLQNLPCIFMIDRAGLVGADGKTHQGVFDISYLSHIPNLTILAPKNSTELKDMIYLAIELKRPVAIRYPSGKISDFIEKNKINSNLKWEVLNSCESKNVILAVGPRTLNLAMEVNKRLNENITVINARTVKPLDSELLLSIKDKNIITLEENVINGGFGSAVIKFYNDNDVKTNIKVLGVKDEFIKHATVDQQLEYNGLTVDNIISKLV